MSLTMAGCNKWYGHKGLQNHARYMSRAGLLTAMDGRATTNRRTQRMADGLDRPASINEKPAQYRTVTELLPNWYRTGTALLPDCYRTVTGLGWTQQPQ
ncbi:hypothetical protein JZ785_19625 [Alicyclobacillus curvatus]|nr:hypothetical protein JZ785_19625 [Alicyclobacillus curvatus]